MYFHVSSKPLYFKTAIVVFAMACIGTAGEIISNTSCREIEYYFDGVGANKLLDSVNIISNDTIKQSTYYKHDISGTLMGFVTQYGKSVSTYDVKEMNRSIIVRLQGDTTLTYRSTFLPDFRIDTIQTPQSTTHYHYSDTGLTIMVSRGKVSTVTDSISYTPWGELWFSYPRNKDNPDSCFAHSDTCDCLNALDLSRNIRYVFHNGLLNRVYSNIFSPNGNPREGKYNDQWNYIWRDKGVLIRKVSSLRIFSPTTSKLILINGRKCNGNSLQDRSRSAYKYAIYDH